MFTLVWPIIEKCRNIFSEWTVTTSRFTESAKDYVRNIDTKVVLIDGQRLTELMIDYGVGVAYRTTYEIKSLDTDYFESP